MHSRHSSVKYRTLTFIDKECWWGSDTHIKLDIHLIHNSPEYLEWNSAYEKLEGFFPLKYAILSFGKCLNYWMSGFQRGDIFFLNCDNTELKDPLKYFFFCFRTASLGGSGKVILQSWTGMFFFFPLRRDMHRMSFPLWYPCSFKTENIFLKSI